VWLYLLIGVMLIVAIGFQIYYARVYAASATGAAKAVWAVNIGLLSLLLFGVVWMAYAQGVK